MVDEFSHIGGNHIDCSIADYTFDVGSLIFQDDSPLLDHFPEMLPAYVAISPSWGKLNPQGLVTGYPISIKQEIVAAGPVEWLRMAASVAHARVFRRRIESARDFARYWIGARILRRTGLENYLERFFGVPADRVDAIFAQKRMLWIREHALLSTWLRRWLRPSQMGRKNQQLARPREGFQPLYAIAADNLKAKGVSFFLGAEIGGLHRDGGAFQLEVSGGRFSADRMVSTIPIWRAQEICGIPRPDKPLESVTLISLFYSFDGERGFPQPILYNFSYDGSWKRLTVYSDFYGPSRGRQYFAVEVLASQTENSAEKADEDFRGHVGRNGLFRGDLRLEGSMTTPEAYPVYTEGADARAAEAIAVLREHGVESFGRQGGFNYQPTARVSTIEAEAALSYDRSTHS